MKTQTKSEKQLITVKPSELKDLEEIRERLASAYKAITDREAGKDKLESKLENLERQLEKLSKTVDPLNDGEVSAMVAKKAQRDMVRERLEAFGSDDSLETRCLETLRDTGAVLRPIHFRKYEELVDGVVRLTKSLYRDEATAQNAAVCCDLILAYQGASN